MQEVSSFNKQFDKIALGQHLTNSINKSYSDFVNFIKNQPEETQQTAEGFAFNPSSQLELTKEVKSQKIDDFITPGGDLVAPINSKYPFLVPKP